ncbi:MAG: ATP-binding protein [Bacteriovoracaceae bacterium]|nr:ATP-binding protein [Bacteriovoracaceae bacterium]
MWYQREISKKILEMSSQFAVVVLTGARQVGKSSILKKEFPGYRYVSLDLPSEAKQADLDSASFLKQNPAPLIIDEVQYAPGLFSFIKKIVDKNPSLKGQYILSGSQKFSFMKGVKESLAGRAGLIELYPLSLQEMTKGGTTNHTSAARPSIEELILRGGMPALSENPTNNPPPTFLRSYLGTYLERDVKDILSVSSLRDFERFLRGCALRSASLINKSDLARDVGVSSTTINEWISVLQISNQVVLLEPWFNNKSKSMVKSPKLYFLDTGLLCYLLNITTVDSLRLSPYLGHIWENFVLCEIYKWLAYRGEEKSLHFWRDRNREVDFVINRGGVLDLIEVKWNSSPAKIDCERMEFFQNADFSKKMKIRSMSVMGNNETPFPIKNANANQDLNIYARSIWDLEFLK